MLLTIGLRTATARQPCCSSLTTSLSAGGSVVTAATTYWSQRTYQVSTCAEPCWPTAWRTTAWTAAALDKLGESPVGGLADIDGSRPCHRVRVGAHIFLGAACSHR